MSQRASLPRWMTCSFITQRFMVTAVCLETASKTNNSSHVFISLVPIEDVETVHLISYKAKSFPKTAGHKCY